MLFCEDRAVMQTSTMRGSCVVDNNTLRKKCSLWYRRSLRGSADRHRHETGSLPRGHRPKLNHSNSLVDYTDPQRSTVVLEKQDNETFGFEIQTYGLQQKNATVTEMCTFVCRVHEDSAAESAGLTAGDIIVTINGVSIEGSSHQKILDLIRESTNCLQMETVCGNVVKRIELEKRLNLLKQTLREKQVELQTLMVQEKRLTRGDLDDARTSSDSSLCSPVSRYGLRTSSDSSFRSGTTDDSDLASVFGDAVSPGPFSAASTADDGCFFPKDFSSQESNRRISSSGSSPGHQRQQHHHHQSLGRTSSSGLAGGGGGGSSSSSVSSPSWEETRISNLFGTLPRKSRKASVRKHIFKLLQRSVEEEEV